METTSNSDAVIPSAPVVVAEEKKAPMEPMEISSAANENDTKKEETSTSIEDYESNSSVGASFGSSVVNMMNTIIGAGTLSLPSTILDGGIFGAGLLLLVSLIFSLIGAHYLVTAAVYTKEDSYGFIGKKVVSPLVGYLADIFMVVFDFGISVGYCNIVFGQTVDLLVNFTSLTRDVVESHKWWIALLETLFIMSPILCVPTVDALKWTSSIAVICAVLFVCISIFLGISQVVTAPLEYFWWPRSFTDFLTALSVFFTCLCSHVNIPKMTSELKVPPKATFYDHVKKMDNVDYVSFILCTLIYYSVGVCGYLAFGEEVAGGNLLDNFATRNVWYLNLVKIAYSFIALFSYPVLSFSPLVAIDKTFFKQPRPTLRRCIEAYVWTLLCYIVTLLIPSLRTVFSLTGALCGAVLIFIWPALFFISISKKEKAKKMSKVGSTFKTSTTAITFAWILIVIGAIGAVVLTSLEIKNIFFKVDVPINRSVGLQYPCYELHYHGRIYILDCGWDISYLNVFLPPGESIQEAKLFSQFDIDQLNKEIVNINGTLFINTEPFIISYNLDLIDWSSVDAIFISSVGSYMLLPIIMRETEFSGNIYVPRPLFTIANNQCLALASISTKKQATGNLTELVHRLPQYHDSLYNGYKKMSTIDIKRVSQTVTLVGYGEVIERDRTVSISCFFDGRGFTSCGWSFKSICSSNPMIYDFTYLPSDQTYLAIQTQHLQKEVIQNSKTVLIATKNIKTRNSKYNTIADLSELQQFIQRNRTDNHIVVVLCEENDMLLLTLEYMISTIASRSKISSISYLDDAMNYHKLALQSYQHYPEYLDESLKRRIIGGMVPFLTFDNDNKSLIFSSLSSRIQNSTFVIIPQNQFLSFYPYQFALQYTNCEFLLLSQYCGINWIEPLLGDSSQIYDVLSETTNIELYSILKEMHSTILLKGWEDENKDIQFKTIHKDEKIELNCELNDIILMKMHQFSTKRGLLNYHNSTKRIEIQNDVVEVQNTVIEVKDQPLIALKDYLKGITDCKIMETCIEIPSDHIRLSIHNHFIDIEKTEEGKEEMIKKYKVLLS